MFEQRAVFELGALVAGARSCASSAGATVTRCW